MNKQLKSYSVKSSNKPRLVGVILAASAESSRGFTAPLMLLDGRTVLEHVLGRCTAIAGPASVILSVPDSEHSEPLMRIADKLTIRSATDDDASLVTRVYNVAKYFKLDLIMYVKDNQPLVDPTICKEVLDLAMWRKTDYCSNIFPTRTYPKGLDCEVFTFDCLEWAAINATTKEALEDFTAPMQKHPDIRRALVSQKVNRSKDDWSVNSLADLVRVSDVIDKAKTRKKNDAARILANQKRLSNEGN